MNTSSSAQHDSTLPPLAKEEGKTVLHVFDFDGTLTSKDSFFALIRSRAGRLRMLLGLLIYSPWLVLMKLRLYSNEKAKQRVFAHFFKGMTTQAFNEECRKMAAANEDMLRPAARTRLTELLESGQRLLIVSASAPDWVRCFFADDMPLTIVGTELEVVDNRLTGRFKTHNCYGAEKVRRLEAVLSEPRPSYHIVAYGDSRGDKELLAYADEGYYKPFSHPSSFISHPSSKYNA